MKSDINLDGIIPSEEKLFDFNESEIKKFKREFNFENITKEKRGIFIIEFIGSGLLSRAVIKKGNLCIKSQNTVAGHFITILDENLEICTSKNQEKTGIWLDKRFYKANENGQLLIPYSSVNSSNKIIIVHGKFSSLSDFTVLPENFDFNCSFIYNKESIIMGK